APPPAAFTQRAHAGKDSKFLFSSPGTPRASLVAPTPFVLAVGEERPMKQVAQLRLIPHHELATPTGGRLPAVDDLTENLHRQLETSSTDVKKLVSAVQVRNLQEIGIPSAAIERWERDDPQSWAAVRGWLQSRRIRIVVS